GLLLAACTSTPLPPWRPYGGTPAVTTVPATRPAPVSPMPAAPVDNPGGAVAVPVPTPGMAPAPADPAAAAPAAPGAPPYNAAVAARFPDPAIAYSTPGLEVGRTTFTSNEEVSAWLHQLAAKPPAGAAAAVLSIGASQQGRPLEALVLTKAGATDAATVLASGKPTVLLVGQQHGNEPAGSEALLVLSRELAQGLLEPLLDRINVIIVPRANPDGAAADTRVTANGIDMNRDHLLLQTPEAQALAKLGRDYKPVVMIDAHEYTVVGRYLEKFGTVQKFDALLQYATTPNLPEFLPRASDEWYRRPIRAALKSQQLTDEWYYTTSTDLADKSISMGGVQPDTGRNVNGLKNAVSLLIETRGVGIGRMHIQRRVHTQVTAMVSVLQTTASRADDLSKLRPYMDKEITSKACTAEAVVEAGQTPAQYQLTMIDPATGADRVLTVDWNSSLSLEKIKARVRPCGYWLSAASTGAVERLQMMGVQVQRVGESSSILADVYRETARSMGQRDDVRGSVAGGGEIIKTKVDLVRGVIDAPLGSYYVSLAQPMANLALAALEPDTQNSYFANHILDSLQSSARVMSEPSLKLETLD
ncbi:MAG: peptidase, partial [Rhodoferax sp.]|nr:peptidase [Rhodoferax sp.]